MVDLHCHSYFSDGKLSPVDLIERAVQAGVQVLALTDHDTTEGLLPLRDAAKHHTIQLIDGIELSVRWKKYDIHVIGLHIDATSQTLCDLLVQQNTSRIDRARQMAERLVPFGVHDAYEKACKIAGHARVGRPHLAQVLIDERLVVDMKTAFKKYLGLRRAAYVPTAWLTIEQAVGGIIEAGGQAVIAHPLKYALTRSKLHELIKAFKEVGGAGMEVVSGEVTAAEACEVAGLCTRYNLLASTGSDFHGEGVSRVSLGQQRPLPASCMPIWEQWTFSRT